MKSLEPLSLDRPVRSTQTLTRKNDQGAAPGSPPVVRAHAREDPCWEAFGTPPPAQSRAAATAGRLHGSKRLLRTQDTVGLDEAPRLRHVLRTQPVSSDRRRGVSRTGDTQRPSKLLERARQEGGGGQSLGLLPFLTDMLRMRRKFSPYELNSAADAVNFYV